MVKGSLLCVIAGLLVATGSAMGAGAQHSVTEHVDLTLVKKQGTTKFQHKGRATGTVNGTVRSNITLTHSVVLKGTVTITTSAGKVRMSVDGRARSLGPRPRFNGKATIDGGTGKYAGAKGTGTFHGMVNRRSWHVTLDATGSYHY